MTRHQLGPSSRDIQPLNPPPHPTLRIPHLRHAHTRIPPGRKPKLHLDPPRHANIPDPDRGRLAVQQRLRDRQVVLALGKVHVEGGHGAGRDLEGQREAGDAGALVGEAEGGGEEVLVDVLVADGERRGPAEGVVVRQDGDLVGFGVDGDAAALDGEVV